MLTNTQKKTVSALFEKPEIEAAKKLRIKPQTLDDWKRDPEFIRAINDQLRENRQAAVRILSRLYLDACRELDEIIKSDDHKDKPKVIIEILKASGLFKELGMEEGDCFGNLIEKLADEPEDTERGEAD